MNKKVTWVAEITFAGDEQDLKRLGPAAVSKIIQNGLATLVGTNVSNTLTLDTVAVYPSNPSEEDSNG